MTAKQSARAALRDSRCATPVRDADGDTEAAWRNEIGSRLQEIDNGALKLIPWLDVRRELLDRLKGVSIRSRLRRTNRLTERAVRA